MPSHPYATERPTAYLDWSTLVYAFEGTRIRADQGQRNLLSTVRRIAERGNLCFSFTHVWELLHRNDRGERDSMAAWLEDLPLVWLLPENAVMATEVENGVLNSAREVRMRPHLPAATSFMGAFVGWDPTSRAFSRALRNPTIPAMVAEVAEDRDSMVELERFRDYSVRAARDLYVDRAQALQNHSREAIEATLDAKLIAGLREAAVEAAASLRARPGSGFFVQRGALLESPDDQQVLAMFGSLSDLRYLPFHLLWHLAFRAMSFEVTSRPSIRSGAFERQRGDYYDFAHLVGAAYCDLFTCDQVTANRTHSGRELLGSAPVITAEGGPGMLARRIEERWSALA